MAVVTTLESSKVSEVVVVLLVPQVYLGGADGGGSQAPGRIEGRVKEKTSRHSWV